MGREWPPAHTELSGKQAPFSNKSLSGAETCGASPVLVGACSQDGRDCTFLETVPGCSQLPGQQHARRSRFHK